jgi:hypothetical protein
MKMIKQLYGDDVLVKDGLLFSIIFLTSRTRLRDNSINFTNINSYLEANRSYLTDFKYTTGDTDVITSRD